MNGRVYDYNLGRFLSVDPLIHPEGGSQGINPYSYMMNNPLSGTDPSGYDPEKEVKTKTKFETQTGSRLKTKVTATSNGSSSYTVAFQGGNVSGVKNAYSNSLKGQGFEVSQIGGQAKQPPEISEGVKSGYYGSGGSFSDYTKPIEAPDSIKQALEYCETYRCGSSGEVKSSFFFDDLLGLPLKAMALMPAKMIASMGDDAAKLGDDAISKIVPGGGLMAHELAGGHAIARHVGVTESQLFSRLASNPKISAASSFSNRSVAERAINETLGANQSVINSFLAGNSRRQWLIITCIILSAL